MSSKFEEHLEELGYVKTDDYQFQKKIDDGVYRMADVLEMPDGNYRVFGDEVDLSEYSQEHIEAIVLSYYDSMNTLCDAYPDEEVRKGIIAECIFETESCYSLEYSEHVSKGQVFEAICRYVDSCEKKNMKLKENEPIYVAILNYLGSSFELLSRYEAELEKKFLKDCKVSLNGNTLCFYGLDSQEISDLMEVTGADYNYSYVSPEDAWIVDDERFSLDSQIQSASSRATSCEEMSRSLDEKIARQNKGQ